VTGNEKQKSDVACEPVSELSLLSSRGALLRSNLAEIIELS